MKNTQYFQIRGSISHINSKLRRVDEICCESEITPRLADEAESWLIYAEFHFNSLKKSMEEFLKQER